MTTNGKILKPYALKRKFLRGSRVTQDIIWYHNETHRDFAFYIARDAAAISAHIPRKGVLLAAERFEPDGFVRPKRVPQKRGK